MNRIDHLCLLADYNAWMNAKLYGAATGLPDNELGADKKAYFGSILGTLNHLIVGDTLWLKRFSTHPAEYAALAALKELPSPTSLDQTVCTDIRSLSEHRQFLDRTITEWTRAISDSDLDFALSYSNMQGIAAKRNFYSLVLHFFNHQTHHRGQVTTLLSQAGVDVGVTDLLMLIPDETV